MFKIDLIGFEGVLDTIKNLNKQVNFATRNTINKLALEVQKGEIGTELPGHLKIRTGWMKPGLKFGVNIKFATKTRAEAVVGSQAPWLRLVDIGGTKNPPNKALAIPTTFFSKDQIRPRYLKPSRVLARSGQGFQIKAKGKSGIYIRTGPGRNGIQKLYSFKPSARIPHLTHFFQFGKGVIDRRYAQIFGEEFANAIRTAK